MAQKVRRFRLSLPWRRRRAAPLPPPVTAVDRIRAWREAERRQTCPPVQDEEAWEQVWEQQRLRWMQARDRLLLLSALWVLPLLTGCAFALVTRSPRVLMNLGLGWLLWALVLFALFHAAIRGVARYQQEIFDLRERGIPLVRLLRHGEQDPFQEAQEEEKQAEPQKAQEPQVNPVRQALTFLWWNLSGKYRPGYGPGRLERLFQWSLLPWKIVLFNLITVTTPLIWLNTSEQRERFHTQIPPEAQQALWLGGPFWWLLGDDTVVVLEDLAQHRFRVLQGPTLGERALATLQRLPLQGRQPEDWIPRVAPGAFYSEGFQRLRKVLVTGVYAVEIESMKARTRDGVVLELTQATARMRLNPENSRLMDTLCRMLLYQVGSDDTDWVAEWLQDLDGQAWLQKTFHFLLETALREFIAQHPLRALLTDLKPPEAERMIWETVLQYGEPEDTEEEEAALEPGDTSDLPLFRLRAFVEQYLEREGVVLEDFTPPTWQLPKELQRRFETILAQLRDLARNFQDLPRYERREMFREAMEDCGKLLRAWNASQTEGWIFHLITPVRELLTKWQSNLKEHLKTAPEEEREDLEQLHGFVDQVLRLFGSKPSQRTLW